MSADVLVPASRPVTGGPLTGIGAIARLILRRDRRVLLVWILVLGALPAGFGASGADNAYPTAAAKAAQAVAVNANPAELALRGPVFAATTGGLAAWTLAGSGMLLAGIVSLLLVIRQTRGEEQAGRRELLGSTVLGRHTPLVAALALVAAGNVAVGVVATGGLIAYGLPVAGSVAFGGVFAAGGILFATVGAVAAQIVEGSGAARGIALAVTGALLVIAGVGDVSGSGLIWASPFGWARRVRSFAVEQWWVFGLFLLVIGVLVAVAFVLSARRDVGAGLVPARPGRATAAPSLRSGLALAWRLYRGAVLAWAVGFLLIGLLLGSAMTSIGSQLDTPAFRELTGTTGGGDPGGVFFGIVVYLLAQIASASGLAAALRMRGQETSGLADVLLAAPLGRVRWAAGHVVVTAVGIALALVALGLGAGLGYGTPGHVLATTVSYLPACLVFAGLAVALFGIAPRVAAPVAWTVLALAVGLDFLGEFKFVGPGVSAVSPFVLTQFAPVAGIVGLSVLAVALTAVGLAGLRRRDMVAS